MLYLNVWNEKGGVGKTTISLGLILALRRAGVKVSWLDKDEQQALVLSTTTLELVPDEEPAVVVVDHGAGATPSIIGKFVILPTLAGDTGQIALRRSLKSLAGSEVVVVINRYVASAGNIAEVTDFLEGLVGQDRVTHIKRSMKSEMLTTTGKGAEAEYDHLLSFILGESIEKLKGEVVHV